jgi:hypothetical protein
VATMRTRFVIGSDRDATHKTRTLIA